MASSLDFHPAKNRFISCTRYKLQKNELCFHIQIVLVVIEVTYPSGSFETKRKTKTIPYLRPKLTSLTHPKM